MQRPIKGYIARQPEPEKPDFGYGVASIGILINDLHNTKKDVIQASDAKLSEIDDKLEQVDKSLQEGHQKVQEATETLKGTTQAILDHVASITQGPAGMDADEERVVNTVLERIPKFDENKLSSSILAQVPKIDETSLLKKFIQQIPKNKADLKIVQETFETDPMSVITKILEMGDTFKLKTTHIEGLDQTMSAFRNQLSRGYLHGGGLSTVSHDNTLSGLGTPASPLSVVGAPASSITGLISAGTDISITGSGTIASPYVINSVVGAGATLATVSAASTTTPNSLYTMTTAIPVEFKTSSGTHLLYLDEVNGRIGIRNAAPVSPLHVTGLADNTSTTALFEQNASGIGIIQLGNASPSQNAKFIFNFGGDNLLTIATNYSGGSNNAIAFSPGGTETVRFKQGGLNGFGTNAPTHTITLSSTTTGIAAYNTTDQTVNYQRITAGWKSSVYEIGSFFGGSASDAMIRIGNNSSGGTTTVNRYFGINSSNATTAAAFDFITTAVSYTSANALMTNLANATFTASSGVQGIVGINPSITQTGSAGYQALWISPFEISTGSGVHYLIDAGTNSAANGSGTHTSKFNVDDTGAGSFASSLVVGSSITAGTTSSNIDISSSVSAITTAVSQYQFASSTTNFFRTGFYGNSPSVLSTGANYSGVIFGNAPIATFTSGTHTWLANVVVRPVGTVTNNGATVTNTASLYIDGFGAGGSNNYSFYVNGGTSVINGNLISTGTLNVNGTTTLATSLSGLLKASSGVVSVASAGTDYQAPITLTTTGTSGAATFIANTLNIPQYSGGSGGITRSVNVVSTATGAGSTAATDYIYLVSGTTTITLPTAVGNTNRYTVSRTDASLTTTIATTSAQTINGASTYTLLSQYASVDLISNGSNWLIV